MKSINNHDLIENIFGYWPEFSDSKLTRFSIVTDGPIEIGVHYTDANKGRSAHLGLRFNFVSAVNLSNLREQNIIDAIMINEEVQFTVVIESAFGLCGQFNCKSIEVTHADT